MAQGRVAIGAAHVKAALREPEEFALRWQSGEARYGLLVWGALVLTAMIGTTSYGMTLGILGGGREAILSGLKLTVAAGLAWAIPFPALYILNSLSGSRLSAGATLLAAAVTTSWGGLALLASLPINWFFSVAIPVPWFVRVVNLVVFSGVGVSMADIFGRVMTRLEPGRGRSPTWCLVLVAALGWELFYGFGLFAIASR
jgi:hypothetical protein